MIVSEDFTTLAEKVGTTPAEVLAVFTAAIGPNEERGYRKWCAACGDWTGHLYLPGKAWCLQRCTRCGGISEYKVVLEMDPETGKPLVVHAGLDRDAYMRWLIAVMEPLGLMWCVERYLEARVRSIAHEKLRQAAERIARERETLKRMEEL